MRIIITIWVCLGFTFAGLTSLSFGQNRQANPGIDDFFWGPDDPAKEHIDIPDKWKGKSAIVLFRSYDFSYEYRGKSIHYTEALRKRIKLQDKSAIEQYSEFSFAEKFEVQKDKYKKEGIAFMGFKVIKPTGEEKLISLDEAVELSIEDKSQKKIAIPGLESGDIIDFYFYAQETFTSKTSYVSKPVIASLSGPHPILKQQISLLLGENFHVNYNYLNGAPGFEQEIIDGNKDRVKYTLTDRYRVNQEEIRWFYPERELPLIKFQISYLIPPPKDQYNPVTPLFYEEGQKATDHVSDLEISATYKDRLVFGIDDFEELNLYLDRKGLFENGKEDEMLEEAYYFLRFKYLGKVYEPILFYQEGFTSSSSLDDYKLLNQEGFISLYGSFLESHNYAFHVLASVPRPMGTISETVIKDEVTLLIKVKDKPLYIGLFDMNSNFASINPSLEGAQAIRLQLRGGFSTRHKKLIIPASASDNNKTQQVTQIKVRDDFTGLLVKRKNSEIGHSKLISQKNLLKYFDFFQEDYARYGELALLEKTKMKKNEKLSIQKKYEEKQAKDREEQLELFKANAEDELDGGIHQYKGFNLLSTGRYGEKSGFSYSEEFEIKDQYITRAGQNFLIEIGKFIGEQVALKPEELTRTKDIYMSYARSFQHEIILKIPEGYTVKGVEKLNVEIENETGGFISTAKIEEGKLKINVFKFYKNKFEPAENWPLMVEFLEAAYQFTQEKILLKKNVN